MNHRQPCVLPWAIWCLTAGLLATPAAFGQGTLVYYNPPDIHLFGNNAQHDLDVDQNGVVDYQIRLGGSFGFHTVGAGSNSTLARPERLPDRGAPVVPSGTGTIIGPNLGQAQTWFISYSFEPIPENPVVIPAYFHRCVTTGCVGQFHNVTAYWGVRFDIDGNDHYGWVRVATPGGIRNGGTILDWAYNSVPGQPILAGQVPEPAIWALLLGGGAMLHLYRRRRLDGKQ
ncbi:MAG TPA: hypothetical protein DCY13_01610 [Verrucomicrobiales bacterium]|nr:hypothetical protein [Verrucomicrobiales bacterium]